MTHQHHQPLCHLCARPSLDAAVCTTCWTGVVADLHLMGWLDDQLTITRTRQDRIGDRGPRHGADTPLGYGQGAAVAQDDLRNTIGTWVRAAEVDYQETTVAALSATLAAYRGLRHVAYAPDLARDLERVRERSLAVVNPADTGMTYGQCTADLTDGGTCAAYLYGPPDATWVRCRRCRAQHAASERRDWMRRRMEVLYFRASTLARLLPCLIERPVSASGIRNWAARGRPIRTSVDDEGWTTYCCGDVITVALTTPARDRAGSAA